MQILLCDHHATAFFYIKNNTENYTNYAMHHFFKKKKIHKKMTKDNQNKLAGCFPVVIARLE